MDRQLKKLVNSFSSEGIQGVVSIVIESASCRLNYLKFRLKLTFYEVLQNILYRDYKNSRKLDLQGFLSQPNQQSLGRLIEEIIQKNGLSNPLQILEIGTWKGLSTSVICKHIIKVHGSRVVCVDCWKYNEGAGEDYERLAKVSDVFSIFKRNIKILGFDEIVLPFYGSSENLDFFRSQYFDLIFIDGDHRHFAFSSDLNNAVRLIKPGGVICGDDGEMDASNFDKEFLVSNRDVDIATDKNGLSCHPGVVLGLHERFGDNVTFENERRTATEGHSFWWVTSDDWSRFSDKN